MKKKWSIVVVFLAGILFFSQITACEPDDLCEHTVTTPRLLVRFKDTENPTKNKNVDKLLVYGKDQNQILSYATTDSLALPLKISESQTTYVMVKEASIDNATGAITAGAVTTVTFSYLPKEQFVSKGCGYKVVYQNLQIEVAPPTGGWIKSVNINKTEVQDEAKAQITIYH